MCPSFSCALSASCPVCSCALHALMIHVPHALRALCFSPVFSCALSFVHYMLLYLIYLVPNMLLYVPNVLLYLRCLTPCVFVGCSCLELYMLFCSSSLTCFNCFKPDMLLCISCLVSFMPCASCTFVALAMGVFYSLD